MILALLILAHLVWGAVILANRWDADDEAEGIKRH